MPPPKKAAEEKLRDLEREIVRLETAITAPLPQPKASKVAATPLSRRARRGRRILAVSLGVWCAFCFGVVATRQGALADPLGLAGLALFMALIGFLLYYAYLFQWALAQQVAGWFRCDRKADCAID